MYGAHKKGSWYVRKHKMSYACASRTVVPSHNTTLAPKMCFQFTSNRAFGVNRPTITPSWPAVMERFNMIAQRGHRDKEKTPLGIALVLTLSFLFFRSEMNHSLISRTYVSWYMSLKWYHKQGIYYLSKELDGTLLNCPWTCISPASGENGLTVYTNNCMVDRLFGLKLTI